MGHAAGTAVIRALELLDAADYAKLRLRALTTDPHAFVSSPEDDFAIQEAQVVERIAWGVRTGDACLLGAFDDALVGALGLRREQPGKLRHRAQLWGFWVAPEHRGRGLGASLIAEALGRARTMAGLELVTLGVSPRSAGARRLYERAGFEHYATEPRFLKLGDEYLDEHLMALELHPPSG